MRVTYDPGCDAAYLYLKRETVVSTQAVTDCVNVDLDRDGHLIGIEILAASRQFPLGSLSQLEFHQYAESNTATESAADGS